MIVSGSNWGLASNAVHFLDLLAFLSGEDEFTLQAIEVRAQPSKRAGFDELTGAVSGVSIGGSRLYLNSAPSGELPLLITIETPSFRVIAREAESKAWEAGQESELKVLFQSQLSDGVVRSLVESGDCGLTPYDASRKHHLAFLRALSGEYSIT